MALTSLLFKELEMECVVCPLVHCRHLENGRQEMEKGGDTGSGEM